MDVLEVPDGVPALVGQIPLICLDFVVDPRSQTLIGNPAHGGEQILETERSSSRVIAAIATRDSSAGMGENSESKRETWRRMVYDFRS